MKVKIIVAGNNDSRHQFFVSLGNYFKYEQAGASLNSVGTGIYKFKLENHDIEIVYLEDHKKVQKNYKTYVKGAVGIIFLDADDETITKLREACGEKVAFVGYRGGGNPDPIKCLQILFERIQAKRDAAARAQHAQFQPPVVNVSISDRTKIHGPSGP